MKRTKSAMLATLAVMLLTTTGAVGLALVRSGGSEAGGHGHDEADEADEAGGHDEADEAGGHDEADEAGGHDEADEADEAEGGEQGELDSSDTDSPTSAVLPRGVIPPEATEPTEEHDPEVRERGDSHSGSNDHGRRRRRPSKNHGSSSHN